MKKHLIARMGKAKTQNAHRIVQYALRSAATASTPDTAIDLLGEALLELERLLARRSARVPAVPVDPSHRLSTHAYAFVSAIV
ncbi:hypothetical protein M3A49_13395 [Paraburkholderia sp. CNPSo 3076]|uniref:hypothetical protein n=1 Tax=Paraburkholderia sp. CNPSo 3076 TaxID=2940936 RepID=UPI002257329A|nr:hypothetical protein [Paraburkholderia sp. CNPSo 3076]MCX5540477.1 hypothetical protein [Paraburkholderia sp. CNPSo 3076]